MVPCGINADVKKSSATELVEDNLNGTKYANNETLLLSVRSSNVIIDALFDPACGLGARSLTQPTQKLLVTCSQQKTTIFLSFKS